MQMNIIHIYGENSLTNKMFLMLYTMVEKEINKIKTNFIDTIEDNLKKILQIKFDLSQLSEEDAIQIVNSIKNEKISLNSILTQFHCRKQKFVDHISQFNLNIDDIKRGRKLIKSSDETIQNISDVHKTWEVGYRHMADTLNISEWETRKVYKTLFPSEKKKKDKVQHLSRYHAKKVNYLWHTDLHFLKGSPPFENVTYYLIAFIDDCSRKIIHFETDVYKDMQFTKSALINCLSKLNVENWPFQLTTDNGMEFKGCLFENALKEYGILHYYIRPRNPEENAKIERWWQNVRKLKSNADIGIVVELYNKSLHHSALTNYLGEKSTPENAYNTIPHFDITQDSIFNQIEYTA